MNKPYQRVLLKLSGEVFGGGKLGVDPVVISGIAKEIAAVVSQGDHQVPQGFSLLKLHFLCRGFREQQRN